jgi:CO/xanthine dehydrogenase Mo-binding subunit
MTVTRIGAYSSGSARYTEDLHPAGMLHCAVVRSPVAAGRIAAVGCERARAVPGMMTVLTARDLPDRRWGTVERDQPILARGVVRFAGEPVALVVAETKVAAAEAAALVDLAIAPCEALVDLEAALAENAPHVHDDRPNVGEAARILRGDVDRALAAAPHVVSTRVRSHRVHQGYVEPRAALAEPDGRGGLVVTMTSQAPFVVRQGLAHLLELPMSRIVVKVPALGGGFGGKLHLGLAPLAAVACLATGRPVQVVASRAEEMHAGTPRENSIVELTSAVADDGRILARRAMTYLDSGAYAMDTPVIASIAALQASGPYRIDAVDLAAAPVSTNTCPTGSFRGPSGPQLAYAVEAHMEQIAAELGIDPIELRRRNLLASGDRGANGELLADVGVGDCLDAVCERLDRWRADAPPPGPGRKLGYGLACASWLTSPAPAGATLAMNEDGTATLTTGATEIGTGAVAVGAALVAAEELGLPLADIELVSGSTDGPHDSGSKGSRTLYGAGNAALEAAREVREILAHHAADELEVAPEDLVFKDRTIEVVGSPQASLAIADVVRGALNTTGPVVGRGRFRAAPARLEGSELTNMRFDALNEPTFHCHGAEIELDTETGRIDVRRYVAAHDVGPVVNPEGARGQVEGGVVQGLGYALTERIDVDDAGIVRNPDLVDYRMPTIADTPRELEVVLIEDHPGPSGPHGAKGIGEAPVILPAAAVGAAIRDAVGRQPLELPLDAVGMSEFLDGA